MKYDRRLTAILLFMTALLVSSLIVPPAFAQASQGQTLSIKITNAFPADLEGDGLINDVVVMGKIYCKPHSSVRVYFILIPPIGKKIVTDAYTIYCNGFQKKYEIHLYDVIKFPGYYTIMAYASWNNENAVSNAFVFDPGGGPGPPG